MSAFDPWRRANHDSIKQGLIFYFFALTDEVFEFSETIIIPAAVGDCMFLGDFDSGIPIVSINSAFRFEDSQQPWKVIFRGVYPTSIETKGRTEFLGQIKADPVREGGVGLAKIGLYCVLRYGLEDSKAIVQSMAQQCLQIHGFVMLIFQVHFSDLSSYRRFTTPLPQF